MLQRYILSAELRRHVGQQFVRAAGINTRKRCKKTEAGARIKAGSVYRPGQNCTFGHKNCSTKSGVHSNKIQHRTVGLKFCCPTVAHWGHVRCALHNCATSQSGHFQIPHFQIPPLPPACYAHASPSLRTCTASHHVRRASLADRMMYSAM